MTRTIELECGECRRVTLLNAATQAAILSKLTQSSLVKIIECPWDQYKFVLSAFNRHAEAAK